MFHVEWTAPPFGATLESLRVPLSFTLLTTYEWSLASIAAVLVVRVETHHDTVSSSAVVWDASGILSFVVLDDKLLLSLFNALPVSIERDVKEHVASEN